MANPTAYLYLSVLVTHYGISGRNLEKLLEISQERLPHHYERTRIRGLTIVRSDILSPFRNAKELKIFFGHILEIQNGGFCVSPKLKRLELHLGGNVAAPTLTGRMFENCNNLEELLVKFDYDHPSAIDEDALLNLTSLKTLDLQHLKMSRLKKQFLKLPHHTLTTLTLSTFHLKEIDSDAFQGLEGLEELQIVNNRLLTHLPNNTFVNTPKLKRLILKHNSLHNPTWYEFKGLDSLEMLNLSGNRIANFDVELFYNHMPKLKTLDISRNPLAGELKGSFANRLKSRFNNSIQIVHV